MEVNLKRKTSLFIDIKFTIISALLFIYPLFVIPNELDYFYLPRYIILAILSVILIPVLFRKENRIFFKALIPLALFLIFQFISSINAIDREVAFLGLEGIQAVLTNVNEYVMVRSYRLTGFSTYIFCVIIFLISSNIKNINKLMEISIIAASIVSLIAIL